MFKVICCWLVIPSSPVTVEIRQSILFSYMTKFSRQIGSLGLQVDWSVGRDGFRWEAWNHRKLKSSFWRKTGFRGYIGQGSIAKKQVFILSQMVYNKTVQEVRWLWKWGLEIPLGHQDEGQNLYGVSGGKRKLLKKQPSLRVERKWIGIRLWIQIWLIRLLTKHCWKFYIPSRSLGFLKCEKRANNNTYLTTVLRGINEILCRTLSKELGAWWALRTSALVSLLIAKSTRSIQTSP